MGDFSTELCGGTHAARTGDIGLFRIISESATAAGIRRIEAVTGSGALESVNQQSDALSAVAQLVKSDEAGVSEKVKAALDKIRTLEKELQQLKEQQAAQESSSMTKDAVSVNGVKLLVKQLTNAEPKMLRTMVDDLKNQLSSGIIVLSTISDDKVSLIAGVTKDLTGKVKAGELVAFIAEQIGGKGGGRPDMAQAGGTDTAALPAAMASVESWVASHL